MNYLKIKQVDHDQIRFVNRTTKNEKKGINATTVSHFLVHFTISIFKARHVKLETLK